MTAWVKFINKTNHKVIYITIDGHCIPVPLVNGAATKYILSPSGSVCVDVFDGQLRFLGGLYISILPGICQNIILC